MLSAISVCSGAGGMDLGFHRAGVRTVALCEFDPWRRDLLAARFPGVPCWPDLSTLDPAELPAADLLIGGTPCQDLSVAGQRAGLDGGRSGLFWDYIRIRNARNIEWAVWENVAGALTSNAGLDFASVLGAFVGADVPVPAGGWPGAGVVAGPWGGACWRVLDAQHFGVPQRRRRVFVAGHLGGPCPPEILLEPTRGSRDHAPRGGAEQAVAATLTRGTSRPGVSAPGRRQEDDTNLVAGPISARYRKGINSTMDDGAMVAGPLVSGSSRGKPTPLSPGHNGADGHIVAHPAPGGADALHEERDGVEQHDEGEVVRGRGGPLRDGAPADAYGVRAADGLARRLDGPSMSFHENDRVEVRESPVAYQLTTGGGKPGQGYPAVRVGDDVLAANATAYDPQPDGRRYAACGDGVAAPVAEWIARRLIGAAA